MKLRQFQVDAFATQVFRGNPAAVIPLDAWLEDTLLQAIAEENNLSETAFFVPTEQGFHLRWFTPSEEVDLCGHATLASAHVLFEQLGFAKPTIPFLTRSGTLLVDHQDGMLAMDFPALPLQPCSAPAALLEGLGRHPVEVLAADDYIAVFENEAQIHAIQPNLAQLQTLDLRGVCITAPGSDTDFVSRFFAPKYGIPEDPVTGSAHCELAPYWAAKLKKSVLSARQVSQRSGEIPCEISGDRVILRGHAVTFMVAEIDLGNEPPIAS